MKQLVINGNKELTGEIKISGAKNSVVALIPAAILWNSFGEISSLILSICYLIALSVVSLPSKNANNVVFKWSFKNLVTPCAIYKDFSLVIALMVSLSLQLTFGKIGVPRYSPIKASMCFLTIGVILTEVGLPIPKFSSRYLNYSSSLIPA